MGDHSPSLYGLTDSMSNEVRRAHPSDICFSPLFASCFIPPCSALPLLSGFSYYSPFFLLPCPSSSASLLFFSGLPTVVSTRRTAPCPVLIQRTTQVSSDHTCLPEGSVWRGASGQRRGGRHVAKLMYGLQGPSYLDAGRCFQYLTALQRSGCMFACAHIPPCVPSFESEAPCVRGSGCRDRKRRNVGSKTNKNEPLREWLA